MGRFGILFLQHPHDLGELVHQVALGVQTTSGVGHHELDILRRCLFDAVEDDRARVCAVCTTHDLDVAALRPSGELLGRCSAECVPGSEQHRATGIDLLLGELANRGRLADPVDANEHPHVGGALVKRLEIQRPLRPSEP